MSCWTVCKCMSLMLILTIGVLSTSGVGGSWLNLPFLSSRKAGVPVRPGDNLGCINIDYQGVINVRNQLERKALPQQINQQILSKDQNVFSISQCIDEVQVWMLNSWFMDYLVVATLLLVLLYGFSLIACGWTCSCDSLFQCDNKTGWRRTDCMRNTLLAEGLLWQPERMPLDKQQNGTSCHVTLLQV